MRCSCGCGRKVGLRDRRANAHARKARKLVAEMEALSFGSDRDEYRRAFLFEGESWSNQYTRVVHGELDGKQLREKAIWTTWLSGAVRAVEEARREQGRTPATSSSGPASPEADRAGTTNDREELPNDRAWSPTYRAARPSPKPPLDVDALPDQAAAIQSSEELAQRIREIMGGHEGVTEGEIFGSVAWFVNGNVACGTIGGALLVRVDRADRDRLLAEEHVRPLSRKGRTMPGFVTVDSDAIADDAELARWIDACAMYAAWLQPKQPGDTASMARNGRHT